MEGLRSSFSPKNHDVIRTILSESIVSANRAPYIRIPRSRLPLPQKGSEMENKKFHVCVWLDICERLGRSVCEFVKEIRGSGIVGKELV